MPVGVVKGMDRPTPLEQPNLERLRATIEEHFDEREAGEGEDSDLPHYIYEEALKALYGVHVFVWLNKL